MDINALAASVADLKSQIQRTAVRLAALSSEMGEKIGCRLELNLQNKMSAAFRILSVFFSIDGKIEENRTDETGEITKQKVLPIFLGPIGQGEHTVQVRLVLQAEDYGVLTYLKGYKSELTSSYSFKSIYGKTINLSAIAFEQGDMTTPFEQKPQIQWAEAKLPLSVISGSFNPLSGGVPVSPGQGLTPSSVPPWKSK
ncbi:hypothetical protein BCY86_06125 [Pajaroellobacter abortibovis]|uniref:Uncharacterized protein n=2 Tax=Pajaroellobacter abortibovis TaxID=1882918 RepID=A0A1L6MXQ4_9BACT|nr:hypothetical protein BCY86_06125 [Pajaroellobacter abortibovis]